MFAIIEACKQQLCSTTSKYNLNEQLGLIFVRVSLRRGN